MNIELIDEPKNIQLCGRGSVRNDTLEDKNGKRKKKRANNPTRDIRQEKEVFVIQVCGAVRALVIYPVVDKTT